MEWVQRHGRQPVNARSADGNDHASNGERNIQRKAMRREWSRPSTARRRATQERREPFLASTAGEETTQDEGRNYATMAEISCYGARRALALRHGVCRLRDGGVPAIRRCRANRNSGGVKHTTCHGGAVFTAARVSQHTEHNKPRRHARTAEEGFCEHREQIRQDQDEAARVSMAGGRIGARIRGGAVFVSMAGGSTARSAWGEWRHSRVRRQRKDRGAVVYVSIVL
jgi:hypothetical protein